MFNTIRILVRHARLLYRYVIFGIMSTYAESMLGFIWLFGQPLIRSLLFTFLAAYVFKARIGADTGPADYAVYILCGMVPWLAFQQGVTASASSLVAYKHIVVNLAFPIQILPVFKIISETVMQLAGFAVICAILVFTKYEIGFHLLWLAVPVILQFLFAVGLGFIFACFVVWIRDLIQIMPHLFYVWMILTPLYYTSEMVPGKAQIILRLNPVTGLFNMYRDIIMRAEAPAAHDVLVFGIVAVATFVFGSWVFDKLRYYTVDLLG